jgi:serine phosphatase RsbU (regulator of sigma subunit)/anti-sigma regulatory factor (Ser/Thr protein kinase)
MTNPKAQNARILLVDDEPFILEVFGTFLEEEGFEVVLAGGGAEALEVLEQSEVDVIITDLSMPGFDGFGLMNAVAILAPDTPVIVLTGMGTLDNAISAIQHGAYDFITKPVEDLSLFLVPIYRAVEKRRFLKTKALYLEQIERQNRALFRDLEAARRIQACLFERTGGPMDQWLSVTVRYQPADLVGGDFLDILPVDEHRAIFYIADVAGHGVLAAMVTAFAKQTLADVVGRVIARGGEEPSPVRILERLNEEVMAQGFEHEGIPLYLTLFLGVVDRTTGRVVSANGGHVPLPRVVYAEGGMTRLFIKGSPIGLVDDPRWEETTFDLGPGDLLVLGTDGLLEAFGEGRSSLNAEEMDHYLETTPDRDPDTLANGLMGLARNRLQGRPQADDISLMILSLPEHPFPVFQAADPRPRDVVYRSRADGLEMVASANVDTVEEMERITLDFLDRTRVEGDRFTVRLLLREALLNAIRHGAGLDPGQKIQYDLRVRPWHLEMRVQDPGPGFDWKGALASGPDPMAVSGRGLTILKAYADEVIYNAEGNQLTLVVRRGGPTP